MRLCWEVELFPSRFGKRTSEAGLEEEGAGNVEDIVVDEKNGVYLHLCFSVI